MPEIEPYHSHNPEVPTVSIHTKPGVLDPSRKQPKAQTLNLKPFQTARIHQASSMAKSAAGRSTCPWSGSTLAGCQQEMKAGKRTY